MLSLRRLCPPLLSIVWIGCGYDWSAIHPPRDGGDDVQDGAADVPSSDAVDAMPLDATDAIDVPNPTDVIDASDVTASDCGSGLTACGASCADLTTDPQHCGACSTACSAMQACAASTCVTNPFASDGTNHAFAPTASMSLASGTYNYTTITIPSGVTITVTGSGVLDLRATGDVDIAGTIDLSGGAGGSPTSSAAGNGGDVGVPQPAGTAMPLAMCTTTAAGEPGGGVGGTGGVGTAAMGGGTGVFGPTCGHGGTGGNYGGGGGGYSTAAGGGGGGFAGGGGGAMGQSICAGSGAPGAGGAGGGPGGGAGGNGTPGAAGQPGIGGAGGAGMPYAGSNGRQGSGYSTTCLGSPHTGYWGGGGGGGSIGTDAIADLAMTSTFRPGSGGGGGGGHIGVGGSAGGAGGPGGALRIASRTSIHVAGTLRTDGGAGGSVAATTFDSGGGGGGSGGAIDLAAPSVVVDSTATVSSVGGPGGTTAANEGGAGGAGGLGRIRISVASCTLNGSFSPPLSAGCTPSSGSGSPGLTFVGTYPN